MTSKIKHLNDITFAKEVIEASHERPVLVDFSATWCGPCKALEPVLEAVANDYAGRIDVAKLDVDESPEVAAAHGIRGIPTLMIVRNGLVMATKVGAQSKDQLSRFIHAHTSETPKVQVFGRYPFRADEDTKKPSSRP